MEQPSKKRPFLQAFQLTESLESLPKLTKRRNGRGGAFPEFKPIGLIRSVNLKNIKCDDRGVDEVEAANAMKSNEKVHVRLQCPHCPGEVIVRQGPSYHKNRNTMIRQHLRDVCEGFPWMTPPPRPPPPPKPFRDTVTFRQVCMNSFMTVPRAPFGGDSAIDSATDSAVSAASSDDSFADSLALEQQQPRAVVSTSAEVALTNIADSSF